VTLNKNLKTSLAWFATQREVAMLMSSSYPEAAVSKWTAMRDDFDRDSSKPNPYQEAEQRMVSCLIYSSTNTILRFFNG
jgi:hypothetical protein